VRDALAQLEASAAERNGLARPLRIVVPSRSLREHVSSVLVREAGRPLLGVRVQTLHAVAHEILERSGGPGRPGDVLLPVFVRRAAAHSPSLRRALEPLHDGYGIVAETVRDLIDAGLRAEQAEQAIACVPGDGAREERARALCEVACETQRALERAGLQWRSARLALARERLERDGAASLPSRDVWVHGFADATGLASDLLAALVTQLGAVLWLDRPPDPLAPERPDPGAAFGARLNSRLCGVAEPALDPGAVAPPPEIGLLRAPGAQAEIRAVAERVARLLEEGVAPERIGIVARRLDGLAVPIRTQLRRLGVPFSGVAARGPADPARRRLFGLAELLRRRDESTADRWLSLLGPGVLPESRLADVRVALHAQGVARLRDVARLDLERAFQGRDWLTLPVRHGLVERDGESRAQSRQISRDRLEGVTQAARRLVLRFESWPEETTLETHVEQAIALVSRDLGWRGEPAAAARATLGGLVEQCGPSLGLDAREFVTVAEQTLASGGTTPLGGAGGGVRVLDATEARARTFEHLFVVGLNRDAFPRSIQEDPLLPDALRTRLAGVLPQMPIKREGFIEERYLFAQLVASSPQVTLSWQTCDDDGRARPPSPFVVRLQLGPTRPEPQDAPPLLSAGGANAAPRPADEHVMLAALRGSRSDYVARLAQVLALVRDDPEQARREARARVAILDEVDPELSTGAGRRRFRALGPYYGFVGAARDPADPRAGPIWITTAESMARCPWQALLTRILRVEQPPDALEALPALDARLVGNAVHAALEAIVRESVVSELESIADALAAVPTAAPWPTPERLEHILIEAATEKLRDEGAPLPGLARALAERARPFVEAARERGFDPDDATALGVELRGGVQLPELALEVRFKADRVDRSGGRVVLTDYKTGRASFDAKKPETRHRKLLAGVVRGEALQVAAYAFAAPDLEGRYLYLKPDVEAERAVASVRHDDRPARDCFEYALTTLLAAWQRGGFFPRLSEPATGRVNPRCDWCAVSTACLQGDSGARRRLGGWGGRPPDEESPVERAVRALWRLPLEDPGSVAGDPEIGP
jgi:RecB family exonuclease